MRRTSIHAIFRRVLPLLGAAAALGPTVPPSAQAQDIPIAFPVQNPEWEILVSDYGYSDLAFDRRTGFAGREYLSGEWAGAIHYAGGQNPAGPVWFEPEWLFPVWTSNSNFTVEKSVEVADPVNPLNEDGYEVFESIIKNADVRVTITYEMLDSVIGIPQGLTPKSAAGAGTSQTSSRYVFRQTYRVTNISGGALTNVRLFQFMHGLETAKSVYDDRDYGGPMSGYRYVNTQQGDSLGFNSATGEIVLHHDTIAFHSRVAPAAWETGYFGRKGIDSHDTGKPPVGTHLKVEANTLDGTDSFQPPEGGWVSGAQRFDLGDLSPGGSATFDVLMSLHTLSEVRFPGVKIVIHNVQMSGGNFLIDFEEVHGAPLFFFLSKSTNLNAVFPDFPWLPMPLEPMEDTPRKGWRRFEIPVEPGQPKAFYRVEAVLIN